MIVWYTVYDISLLVDCKWGSWQFGNCTQECGTGHLLQQREIWILAENGGISCSRDSYRITNIECNTKPCPSKIFKYIEIKF